MLFTKNQQFIFKKPEKAHEPLSQDPSPDKAKDQERKNT